MSGFAQDRKKYSFPDITNKDIKFLYGIFFNEEFLGTNCPDLHYINKHNVYYLDDVPIPNYRVLQKKYQVSFEQQKAFRRDTSYLKNRK
jgi:hypothetical protein